MSVHRPAQTHGPYLSRPPAQLETYRAGAGSTPIAYMLGNRGADLLVRKYGWRRAAVDWTAKARTATRGEIEHAIEITDFMVALDIACRRRCKFAVMYFDEILRELAPQATREAPRPYHWPVSTSWQGSAQTLYVIPDRVFGIRDLTRRGDRAVKFFAYERDRGTMPVVRSNLAQSSILRKLIGYGATHRSGLHTAMYGLPNFRVLTEAPGPKRVANMILEGYQRHLCPDLSAGAVPVRRPPQPVRGRGLPRSRMARRRGAATPLDRLSGELTRARTRHGFLELSGPQFMPLHAFAQKEAQRFGYHLGWTARTTIIATWPINPVDQVGHQAACHRSHRPFPVSITRESLGHAPTYTVPPKDGDILKNSCVSCPTARPRGTPPILSDACRGKPSNRQWTPK